MKRLIVPLAAVVLLCGCGDTGIVVGGELPKQVYARVVSLSPSTTELVAMLNAEKALVGRTAACDNPETIRNTTIVANTRPDIEKIVSLQADLVIADAAVARQDDMQRLREQGIEVYLARVNSIEDWKKVVWDLGNKLQQQQVASQKVDVVTEAVERSRSDPISPQPRVMIAMGGDRPWVAGIESFQADVVRSAGAEPVGPPGAKYVQASLEQVIRWQPDVIIVSDSPDGYSGPAWASTPAGKRDLIIGVDADRLLRAGARVADVINAVGSELRLASQKGALAR